MVAPKENLLSLGHQINMEQRTFKTQRVETQKQKTLHLLQHCQEMQEGVIRAQQHNRQLLQQFKEAQGTLREMLTLTAAMKTTRMEYEKHLVGIPQWRQQLQNTWEKTFRMVPPRNPEDSTRAPPHLPSNPLQFYHQVSGHRLHQSLLWQNVPDQPWFWPAAAAGTSSGPEARFCVAEPSAESGQHSQMSSAPSSYKKSAGNRNSPSGLELDTQPVRLLCSADVSDSTTESSQVSRKKRGKSKHTFSEGERHSSPNFQAVSVVMTGVEAAQRSGSVASSGSRSTMKSAGADVGPLNVENGVKERNKKNEDSQPSSEECEQPGGEESGSQRESSRSVDIKMNNEYLSSRSERKNEEVKDDERQREEEPEESDENVEDAEKQKRKEEDISKWNNTTDEEENAETEEEMEEQESEESDGLKDTDNRKLDTTKRTQSSENGDAESEGLQKEDEASDGNNKTQDSSYDEEEDEMEEVAKKKGHEAAQGEDESDSDDCIISTQQSKRLHIIPEEAQEDEDEEAKPGNSGEDSDEFSDDIRDPKTQEKEMKHEQKSKGFCNRMEIFQVETEEGSSHGDQPSDSDEFDHFFD